MRYCICAAKANVRRGDTIKHGIRGLGSGAGRASDAKGARETLEKNIKANVSGTALSPSRLSTPLCFLTTQ